MSSAENRVIRSRVCAGLAGTVVEIGFGSGLNVPYYPVDVSTVHAGQSDVVEPHERQVAESEIRSGCAVSATPLPVGSWWLELLPR